jgi:hypothetical protein
MVEKAVGFPIKAGADELQSLARQIDDAVSAYMLQPTVGRGPTRTATKKEFPRLARSAAPILEWFDVNELSPPVSPESRHNL